VDPSHRFGVMREHILAMRVIWTRDVADFHGRHVTVTGVMSWPKPIQKPYPPILVGGRGPKVLDRVFEYGDGWAPDVEGDVEEILALQPRIDEFRRRSAEADRGDLRLVAYGARMDERCVEAARELGFDTYVFGTIHGSAVDTIEQIERAGQIAAGAVV
jgi:alkanesulfonate monooxygenase SsuD/methylene tetrahydromethanopterin reductase-like flavin-dependent oxidoreductase (luciferase family)